MNTPSTQVISQQAAEPVGPYPHARKAGGLLFLSGIGPRKRDSKEIPGVIKDDKGQVISYDIAAQTHACIENVKFVLKDAGLGLEDVIDIQVFLTNIEKDFQEFNACYSKYFRADNGPSRTTLGVTGLPTTIHIELKVIAAFRHELTTIAQ